MGGRRRSSAEIIEALKATRGMVYLAAERLGCSHELIYDRIRTDPAVKEMVEHLAGQVNDITEGKLFEAIENGEPWAIRFRLSQKAKDRGYGEKVELTGPGEGPLRFTFRFDGDPESASEAAAERTRED